MPQRGNVMAYLGTYTYRTLYEGELSDINETLPGFSLIASGDVSNHGALEMAAIYFNKYYFREEAGGRNLAERVQAIHISIAYRRYWAPSFATSVGVYTSYPMGGVKTIHTDFAPTEGVQTSAWYSSESGIDVGLQGEIWQSGLWAVMAEARYSYAITKQPNEYSDQAGFFLGVRYFIQSRVEHPKTLQAVEEKKPAEIKTEVENKQDETAPPEKGTTKPKSKRKAEPSASP
ncbi:hypothetical protein B9G69_011935 [Bdellovibrio sp. SKB1291214]|uniref:hypothetical protein n=1 Tax=Bdellovibrio sp. SKB1291214 TaxID=1732569 RepID=UPI00223F81ED|nr:hypothetical protein [Bdellovibrio sp. SKB1291214]UYL07756.1 hypothetical protein B9G69_011935 [Bdellovibrio sp. SKB1291214]